MNNWYVYERLCRIRQDEIRQDARNAQLHPLNLRATLANRKLLLVVGLPLVLAFIANTAAGN